VLQLNRTGENSAPVPLDVVERARKYLAKVPPAISGQGGHNQTIYAAGKLIRGFGLERAQAHGLLREWNQSCQPPWSEKELAHKIDDAIEHPGERGYLLHSHGKTHWTRPFDEQVRVTSLITNAAEVAVASDTTDSATKIILQPLPMPIVLADIREATGDWPRRMGPALFVADGQGGVSWLESEPALFGYLGHRTGCIKWHKCLGAPTKAEVYAEVQRTATAYLAVEELPHYPQMPGTYYACREYQPGDGSALRGLLDRLNPATDIDRDLTQAALMTTFAGDCPWLTARVLIHRRPRPRKGQKHRRKENHSHCRRCARRGQRRQDGGHQKAVFEQGRSDVADRFSRQHQNPSV
jgi:hypothetical protein